jgi:hypothetical protein
MSQNRGYQLAYPSSPSWYVSVDNHGDDNDDNGAGWG